MAIKPPPFQGRIGRTWRESQAQWPAPPAAPAGAPNVLFIVLDDVGYSDLGCFGSEIRTPRMDGLAAAGLRYNNFHVTAMCSPTRASLLTGRNAHAVGVGSISEMSNGFPGYQGRITPHAATAAEILEQHAFGAYAVGKWHLSNLGNYGTAGPHEHWPLGRGFSRWYGFLGGFVDHWHPDLHEDNHPVRHEPRPGYHLTEDLVDHAIGFVRDHITSANGRPWFTYLALGAGHWPLHVPAEFIERYRGVYDAGWDAIRESRLARQKHLGIVPEDTPLPVRNPGVRAWADVPGDERQLCIRLQETYAAFMEHADTQIGRLLDYLAQTAQLENTLIVLLSDNGASGEGGPTGAVNIRKHLSTEKETIECGLARLDQIGGEYSFPHYPTGWAQASNTPLKWFKKNTHGGGIRAPLVVHWPKGIQAAGEIRSQYHHVSDILPTVLEAVGAQAPRVYKGLEQMPLHGTSMLYSFQDAQAPTRKELQHFEMVGDRAIWQRGWKAVARHEPGEDFDSDRWELYNLDQDFSEVRDLAAQFPEKLRELVALWWSEAQKYDVLPLDDRYQERVLEWASANMNLRFELLPGMARLDRQMVPPISDRSFAIQAEFERVGPASSGIVLACGSRFAGYVLYCKDGFLVFEYVFSELKSYILQAPLEGDRKLTAQVIFERTGQKAGRFSLLMDGKRVGCVDVPKTWTVYGISSGLTCGLGNAPVSDACPPPSEFNGVLRRVLVEVVPSAGGAPAPSFVSFMQEE